MRGSDNFLQVKTFSVSNIQRAKLQAGEGHYGGKLYNCPYWLSDHLMIALPSMTSSEGAKIISFSRKLILGTRPGYKQSLTQGCISAWLKTVPF